MIEKKIAIFENQFVQFEDIHDELSVMGYEIIPEISGNNSQEGFALFLKKIKVILDNRYDSSKTKAAIKYIAKCLEEFSPDLLIIDHNLIGLNISHTKSGIDLAEILYSSIPSLHNTPVLFLSRSLTNDPEVAKGLNKLKKNMSLKYEWCAKGFTHSVGFDPDYFKDFVIDKLESLIQHNETEEDIPEQFKLHDEYHKLEKFLESSSEATKKRIFKDLKNVDTRHMSQVTDFFVNLKNY